MEKVDTKQAFINLIRMPESNKHTERLLMDIEKNYPWFSMPSFIRLGVMKEPKEKKQILKRIALNFLANNHYPLQNGGVKIGLEQEFKFVLADSVERNDCGDITTDNGCIVVHEGKLNEDSLFPKGRIVITPSGLFYSEETQGYKIIKEVIAVNQKNNEKGEKFISDRTSEIIDIFLNKKIAKITPQDTVSQGGNIDLSDKEVDEIVTESMANIYLSQGLKNEAITIYNKLCLKNPEKSSYFAELISTINRGV